MEMKKAYLSLLAGGVEENLTRFDPDTGRFMTGDGWAVTSQDIVYPLALLYTMKDEENPYYHDERILDHIVRGADAWRDFQNPDGSVEFIKVDGSTWGPTFMPWSMYHWLECYALVRDVLSPERRARWEEGGSPGRVSGQGGGRGPCRARQGPLPPVVAGFSLRWWRGLLLQSQASSLQRWLLA